MLQLLRRARQKVLADNGFSKYFLYALGEILLIVIGILIAVSINTANENRKIDDIRDSYYQQLLVELDQDSALLLTQLDVLNTSITSYNSYIDRFKTPNLEVGQAVLALSQVDRRVRNRKVVFNTNSISTLEFTGEIKYIPNEIRDRLVSLKRLQEFTATVDNENDNMYLDGLHKAMQLGFSPIVYRLGNQPKLAAGLNLESKWGEILLIMEASLALRNTTEVERIDRYKNKLADIGELKQLIVAARSKLSSSKG